MCVFVCALCCSVRDYERMLIIKIMINIINIIVDVLAKVENI